MLNLLMKSDSFPLFGEPELSFSISLSRRKASVFLGPWLRWAWPRSAGAATRSPSSSGIAAARTWLNPARLGYASRRPPRPAASPISASLPMGCTWPTRSLSGRDRRWTNYTVMKRASDGGWGAVMAKNCESFLTVMSSLFYLPSRPFQLLKTV